MPSLVFSHTEHKGRATVTVDKRGDDGNVIIPPLSYTFDKPYHRKEAARLLGVSLDVFQLALTQFQYNGKDQYPLDPPNVAPIIRAMFRVRAERGCTSVDFRTLPEALSSNPSVPSLVEWSDIHDVCCLDLDFHGVPPPDAMDLCRFAGGLQPNPAHWWISKGGGLHAIYNTQGGYPANEIAAVAGLSCLSRFPEASLELKTTTRFPPGERHDCTQSGDGMVLGGLFGDHKADEGRIAEYLEERGMAYEPGRRYPHSHCPCDPEHTSVNPAPPVVVLSDGIYCHSCAGRGITRGSRKPGWFPYHSLCGHYTPSLLRSCVDGFAHWGHVRHLLAPLYQGLSESVIRALFSGLLRTRHGNDPRIPRAMVAGEPLGLIRFAGYWVTGAGEAITMNDRATAKLAALPAAQYVTEEGEVKTSAEKVADLAQPVDLTLMGYPAIHPIYGIQLTQFQPMEGKVYTTLPTERLRSDMLADKRPKYLAPSERMPEEDAWQVLERAFPRVDRAAVTLCIVAKGCAESHSGLPPMIFFTGPTGSGKTSSVLIAAAICGDQTSNVQYESTDRLRASILESKRRGSFVIFDEFLKGARRAKVDPDAAMETLLGFTPDSTSHKLYVGPVPLGYLPVLCWADTAIPPDIQGHQQIGRRVWHVPLFEEMSWEESLRREGIHHPESLRVKGGKEYIDAANTILSGIVDKYFQGGDTTDFATVAASLGFRQLRDSDLSRERQSLVATFFGLLGKARDASGRDKARWPGKGWKVVNLGSVDEELTQAWLSLCDRDRYSSRLIEEMDLKRVCGLKCKARFETRAHGAKVACRFVGVGNDLTNGDLKDAPVELEPVQSGVDGLGNPECIEPPHGGCQDIPPALDNPDHVGGLHSP